jgi:putative ABC transport system ATP-binding protein
MSIRAQGIEVRANGRTLLEDVDLEVGAGEIVCVVGPSGSGKTTLLSVLGGLLQPTQGHVEIDDARITGFSDRARSRFRRDRIGFVFQSFHVLADRSILENATLPARLGGKVKGGSSKKRATELLERLGLGKRLSSQVRELSGGERQRLALARALFYDPSVLLCDEPTGNLDPKTGGGVVEWLSQLAHDDGRKVLVVTHDPALEAVADRVVRLLDGRVQS